jgi:type I restriction enzyme S subunit
MLSDLIYRLTLRDDAVDGRFLAHYLTLPVGRSQIEMDARGTSASMVKISQDHIKNWLVPVPPIREQQALVDHLADEVEAIEIVRTTTKNTVSILRERRSALIAAAVTGQLDVGEAA